jgi:streptomycin 6-kinase
MVVDHTEETQSSFLTFGERDGLPVVLKFIKKPGDEWRSGHVLESFDGRGVVRAYEWTDGAVLMERLVPGNPLVELSLNGRDQEATDILADVILRMSPRQSAGHFATVEDWGKAFDWYIASGDQRIPKWLVEEAARIYAGLSQSQTRPRLLHGDLQHYNVLFDSARGWLAIDPKGVVGEVEFELGAAFRNPWELPELFVRTATIQNRLERFASELDIDPRRALAWAFAQGVLSAIWLIEDGFQVDPTTPPLRFAEAALQLLKTFARSVDFH